MLTGGAGADRFVFAKAAGVDRLADFTQGEDVIDLTALPGPPLQWWGASPPTGRGLWQEGWGTETRLLCNLSGDPAPEFRLYLPPGMVLELWDFLL